MKGFAATAKGLSTAHAAAKNLFMPCRDINPVKMNSDIFYKKWYAYFYAGISPGAQGRLRALAEVLCRRRAAQPKQTYSRRIMQL